MNESGISVTVPDKVVLIANDLVLALRNHSLYSVCGSNAHICTCYEIVFGEVSASVSLTQRDCGADAEEIGIVVSSYSAYMCEFWVLYAVFDLPKDNHPLLQTDGLPGEVWKCRLGTTFENIPVSWSLHSPFDDISSDWALSLRAVQSSSCRSCRHVFGIVILE